MCVAVCCFVLLCLVLPYNALNGLDLPCVVSPWVALRRLGPDWCLQISDQGRAIFDAWIFFEQGLKAKFSRWKIIYFSSRWVFHVGPDDFLIFHFWGDVSHGIATFDFHLPWMKNSSGSRWKKIIWFFIWCMLSKTFIFSWGNWFGNATIARFPL